MQPLFLIVIVVLAFHPAPAFAQGDRSVALVIDASGSMNARLPDGITRMDAAKSAVARLVATLPAGTRLSLRAYGHQSPTRHKDCKDTAQLVAFDAVENNRAAIVEAARGLEARGYTPITYVLQLAARDVGREEAASRAVVLVSDGKETCEGDPCLAARALAEADAKLVVHTVGIGVDAAAKYQLACIARMARGTYFDATSAAELASILGKAAETKAARQPARKAVEKAPVSKLQIKGAAADFLDIVDAETGRKVADASVGRETQDVPPGLYRVRFPNGIWQGIVVEPGATTVIQPGVLEIASRDLRGHRLIEPETGETLMTFSVAYQRKALLPTRMHVGFGEAIWPDVELKPGEVTVLEPGVVVVVAPSPFSFSIRSADGAPVIDVTNIFHTVPLPPGRYVLEAGGKAIPIDLVKGQRLEIALR